MDIDEVHEEFYSEYARGPKMCTKVRAKNLKKLQARDHKPDFAKSVKILFADCLHILDIFTDATLAKMMYDYSRENIGTGLENEHDYNICFVWIVMTIFGPQIIQFSTRMNILYHKGIFQRQSY